MRYFPYIFFLSMLQFLILFWISFLLINLFLNPFNFIQV